MSEILDISPAGASKRQKWDVLLPQIKALLEAEPDPIARMANVASVIEMTFGHLWVGFYRVVGDELVLGPFQGPLACTRIRRGRGVCGTAWAEGRTLVVEDVEAFPGHIACSGESRSEIVVPVFGEDGEVKAVIDIDSRQLAAFDRVDADALEQVARWISAS